MAMAMTEETSASLQRGLSEWWSEETEYIFQRIERWAAFARGYNRLRSERLSRGRLTMQEEQESRWSISSNKIVIDDPNWSPRFHNLRRSHRRKSWNDENCRINCCGTFNYQSSCNLDSNCLENYRYDHSIYFKTIGDIKNSKRESASSCNDDGDREIGTSGDESLEWKIGKNPNEPFDHLFLNGNEEDDESDTEFSNDNGNVCIRVNDFPINLSKSQDRDKKIGNFWPIVDLDKLNLDKDRFGDESGKIEINDRKVTDRMGDRQNDSNNNHFDNENGDSTDKMIQLQITQLTADEKRSDSIIDVPNNPSSPQRNHVGIMRIMSMRKSRRNSRKIRQPAVAGDNNILWPGVLLNYTKNIDNSAMSPHHYRSVQVK